MRLSPQGIVEVSFYCLTIEQCSVGLNLSIMSINCSVFPADFVMLIILSTENVQEPHLVPKLWDSTCCKERIVYCQGLGPETLSPQTP